MKKRKAGKSWHKPFIRIVILTALAGGVSTAILYGLQRLENRVTQKVRVEEKEQATIYAKRMKSYVELAKRGRFQEALTSMHRLKSTESSAKQNRDWLEGMAQVYDWHSRTSSATPDLHYRLSQKYYKEALAATDAPQDLNSIFYHQGRLQLHFKNYSLASRFLNRLDRNIMSPEQVWQVDMWRAICDWELKSYQKALDLINQVINASDDQDIWAKSVVQSAEWMLEASQNPQLRSTISKTAMTRVAPETLRNKAEENFDTIIIQTDMLTESHGRAQLGKLKILLLNKKMNDAYKVATTIQTEVMKDEFKIKCLEAIADAEEKRGKEGETKLLAALEYGHKHFPNYTRANPLTRRLYIKLVDIASTPDPGQTNNEEKWNKAFDIAEGAVRNANDPILIDRILNDFHPGQGRFFDFLNWKDKTRNYYPRVQDMLSQIINQSDRGWQDNQATARFLRSALPVAAEEFSEAERSIALILHSTKDPDYRSWLIYLDMFSANRMNKPPYVRALRANRYIREFPKGKYIGEAITTLMQAYYEMGLFEQAMQTAKLMFIRKIVKLGDSTSGNKSKDWLKTVMKIAQCYARQGRINKANTIYRNYREDIIDRHTTLPDDIYVDYAELAMRVDQHQEAIRRLELIEPKISNLFTRRQQHVARSLRGLKVDEPGALKQTERLIQVLEQSEVLDESAMQMIPKDLPKSRHAEYRRQKDDEIKIMRREVDAGKRLNKEQRDRLIRQLYEGILDFSFSHSLQTGVDIEKTVEQTYKRFPDETWPEIWIMRMLLLRFDQTELSKTLENYKTQLKLLKKGGNSEKYVKAQISLIEDLIKTRKKRLKLQKKGVLR